MGYDIIVFCRVCLDEISTFDGIDYWPNEPEDICEDCSENTENEDGEQFWMAKGLK